MVRKKDYSSLAFKASRRLFWGAFLVLFSVFGGGRFLFGQASSGARVVEVQGTAHLDRGNVLSLLKAGDELTAGDLVRTGENSKVLIQWISDDSLVKLSPSSEMKLCESGGEKGENCAFVTQGIVWGKKEKKGSAFQIKTALANLGVRGTEYFVKILPRSHELLVKQGRVYLEKEGVEAGDGVKVVFQGGLEPRFSGVTQEEIQSLAAIFV